MPKHYAVDVNVVSGTVHLENTKTAAVAFYNSAGNPVAFNVMPRIQITLLNASANAPYKSSNVKTGSLYMGFVIGFQNAITADVEWQVMERV